MICTVWATNRVKSQGRHNVTIGTNFTDIKCALLCGWSLLILIGSTIAFNALFMQQARHPAPFYATRVAASDTGQLARPANGAIRWVQTALKELRYYSGSVDGVAGAETEVAIFQFEQAARLPVTGKANEALLARLNHALTWQTRSQSHITAETVGLSKEKAPSPDPMVAVVQEALSDAAYGPLTGDGIMGRRTIDAIRRFQLDQGMKVTGAIDDSLITRLIDVGAMDGGRR